MTTEQTAPGAKIAQPAEGKLRRRGLVAGAAALVAAVLAREAVDSTRVAAANGGPVVIGTANSGTASTSLSVNVDLGSGSVFVGNGSPAHPSNAGGLAGIAGGSSAGVTGFGGPTNGPGVQAVAGGNGNAIYGLSSTGIGVLGVNQLGGGAPYGVVGSTLTPGFGLYGVATVPGSAGFAAGGQNGAYAGQFGGQTNFFGTIYLGNPGNAFVVGAGVTKNAAVPLPDGTHGLLHCVEAPEAWFEDFGVGQLVAGKAEIKLDADFAGVVDTGELHVFLTPHDTAHHLAATAHSANGFSVEAVPSTTAAAAGKKVSDLNGSFTFRVVARRKDVKAERFTRFDVPKEIVFPMPKIPPAPKRP